MRTSLPELFLYPIAILIAFLWFLGSQDGRYEDVQYVSSMKYTSPLFIFFTLSLTAIFYLRGSFFSHLSRVAGTPSTKATKAIRIRQYSSWALIVLFTAISVVTFWGGINQPNTTEYVEYAKDVDGGTDFSQIIYASNLVIDCEYNEECVAAHILKKSVVLDFLTPDEMNFEPGDPEDYNRIHYFTIDLAIMVGYSFLFFGQLYNAMRFTISKLESPIKVNTFSETREYYAKKSHRSYSAFLFCLLILQLEPLVYRQASVISTPLAVISALFAMIIIVKLCSHFLFEQNSPRHLSISSFYLFPLLLLTLSSFLITTFTAPQEEMGGIWMSSMITDYGSAIPIFDGKSNFSACIGNLIIGGLLSSALFFGFGLWLLADEGNPGLVMVSGIFSILAGLLLLLGIYGYLATIFVGIVSLNPYWVSTFILVTSSVFMSQNITDPQSVPFSNPQRQLRKKSQVAKPQKTNQKAKTKKSTPTPKNNVRSGWPYSAIDGWGAQFSIPNPNTGKIEKFLVGPKNLRSEWFDRQGIWVAFSKKELIQILKWFQYSTMGNKTLLIERCSKFNRSIKIQKESANQLLFNPETLQMAYDSQANILLPQTLQNQKSALLPVTSKSALPEDTSWQVEHRVDDDGTEWAQDENEIWYFRQEGAIEWGEWIDDINPLASEKASDLIKSEENEKPVKFIDQSTQMLGSKVEAKELIPRKVSIDSNGITTIETEFSIVMINQITNKVTKIPRNSEQNEMFYQEIKNMQYLDSKGFDVGLLDFDNGPIPKIVTRFFGPHMLEEVHLTLSKRGKAKLLPDLIFKVSEMHTMGLVHRDLKPKNILVDERPRDGNHQFDAIIDYGIAMKINRKQSENHNTAGTFFFAHPSQKEKNFNASTGQDWFSLARIFALILRGVSVESLDAEIQSSQRGLDLRTEIQELGFKDKVVDSITEMILQATQPSCDDNETIETLARIGKELVRNI